MGSQKQISYNEMRLELVANTKLRYRLIIQPNTDQPQTPVTHAQNVWPRQPGQPTTAYDVTTHQHNRPMGIGHVDPWV